MTAQTSSRLESVHRRPRSRVALRWRSCLALLCAAVLPLTSPAAVQVAYIPALELNRPAKKDWHSIDIYPPGERVTRAAAIIGTLVLQSDGRQTVEDLVQAAQAKAGSMGADFLIISKIAFRNQIHTDPSFAFALPFLHVPVAGAVSGTLESREVPALLIAVGAYRRSSLGVLFVQERVKQQQFIIDDFNSDSPLPALGVNIGDELMEVNGLRVDDKRTRSLLLEAPPGTVLTLRFKRGEARMNIDAATIAQK